VNEYGAPVPESALLGERTGFTVVSDNVFGTSGPWPVTIGPQDGLTDAALSHLIFERNRVHAGYGETGSQPVAVALLLWGRHFTVRNNILDGSGGGGDFRGIIVERRGVEPAPHGIAVYHNTIYRADNGTGNERYGICIGTDAVGTVVKNNLVSFPAAAVLTILLQDRGRDTHAATNLLLPDAGFLDAENANPLLRDFRLGSGSAARGQGEPVPVYEDHEGNSRSGDIPDCGAGGRG
jgi:hypothetical protein